MAKRKKKSAGSRKKKSIIKLDPGPLEFEGWKLGDEVWFCLTSEATPRRGKIEKFYLEDNNGPALSLMDLSGGGYRVTSVKFIFETKKEAKNSRPELIEFWKNLKR
jgi:hypothetical protein